MGQTDTMTSIETVEPLLTDLDRLSPPRRRA
jgi:hypothetical protein